MLKGHKILLSLFIITAMIVSSLTVPFFASVSELGGAEVSDSVYNVYVEGYAGDGAINVTFLLKNAQNQIGYIEQIAVDNSGKYAYKFRFRGDIGQYNAYIKDGDSVINPQIAYAEKANPDILIVDITPVGSGKVKLDAGDVPKVSMSIKNKYGNGGNMQLIIAAFDENANLIGCAEEKINYGYFDIDKRVADALDGFVVPENAKSVKAYVWSNFSLISPMAQSKSVSLIDTTFNDNGRDASRPWIVGFVGDSITHHSYWTPFVEHYYTTRYPDRNIMFVNKGIAGDTVAGVIKRLDYDIFNTSDNANPLQYCDEITMMLACNDCGFSLYRDCTNGDETYQENSANYDKKLQNIKTCIDNYEKVINYCQSKNIKITVVTGSIYDESDRFSTEYADNVQDWFGMNWAIGEVAKGVRSLAEKYGVNCIDMYKITNEYTSMIRSNNPNVTKVLTGGDRVHLSDIGGYLFGYLFTLSHDSNSLVADVQISAANGSSEAVNADVTVTESNNEAVEYTYKAGSLPIAADTRYNRLKNEFGIDLSETVNREIIKIDGLDDGRYDVVFDDVTIGTYSAQELSGGINIADNSLNPGQVQSMQSYNKTYSRIHNSSIGERTIRYIAMTEKEIMSALSLSASDVLGYSVDDWLAAAEKAGKSNTRNYADNKKKESDMIASFGSSYAEEKQLASPVEHKVRIEKNVAESLSETNLFLVSHSQCADYKTEIWFPRTGWGQYIGQLFDTKVTVKNRSKAGWSLEAFMKATSGVSKDKLADYENNKSVFNNPEGSVWAGIKAEIQQGDYVVISHGINDYSQTGWDVKDSDGNVVYSWATTSDKFKENIKTVVTDIRAKGATPIIATDVSPVRTQMHDLTNEFYNATKDIAAELGVTFIDTLSPHREMYLNTGIDSFKNIYNITPMSLAKYKENGTIGTYWTDNMNTNDDVHFSDEGSKLVAKLFADALRQSDNVLKKYLK